MRLRAKVCLCLLPALMLSGCSRAVRLDAPAPAAEAAEFNSGASGYTRVCGPADTEILLTLLDGAAELQPCTAGSSLRLAALAGSLLRWQAENPGITSDIYRSIRVWAVGKEVRELRKIAVNLCRLRSSVRTLTAEELRSLLWDAGFSMPHESPSRNDLCSFLTRLLRMMPPRLFSLSTEKMNIFRANH